MKLDMCPIQKHQMSSETISDGGIVAFHDNVTGQVAHGSAHVDFLDDVGVVGVFEGGRELDGGAGDGSDGHSFGFVWEKRKVSVVILPEKKLRKKIQNS
jgi:hypothetical protein